MTDDGAGNRNVVIELVVGTVVSGRYRLEAPLGSGATAAVWRARDRDLGRVVALKLLLGSGVDSDLAARFEREGTILGRLAHPNLVRVLASGSDDEQPYLVMELVDGVTLKELLAGGPLAAVEAVALAADIAAGLGAAHRAGVVHRDVKPANVIRGHDGVPRLVDFGIARVSDLTAMTRTDVVLGTASYLSPEQARGETPGPPSDVYSLGCVLYELLTGRPPFESTSAVAVAYRHVHDEPTPPSVLRPDVPAAVEAIVLRCLAKLPADRYATAAELERDLRAPAAVASAPYVGEATTAMPAVAADGTAVLTAAPPAARPPSRRGVLAAAGAGVAAFVVAFLLVGFLHRDTGASSPPAPAPTTTVPTTTVPTTTTTTTTATAPTAPIQITVKHDKGGGGD